MKHYFKVRFCKETGGQVQSAVVEFNELSRFGDQLRSNDFAVLHCAELV